MKTAHAWLPLALLLLSGCRSDENTQASAQETPPAEDEDEDVDPVATLRAHEAELMTRAEKNVAEVRVQHVLVAFEGARQSRATRTEDEAEALTADIYARLRAGADMGELVRQYSDDSGPGVYTMTKNGRPGFGVYARGQMVPAFGDVSWRLEVGEVGVAPYDPKRSWFGWHVIKRLK